MKINIPGFETNDSFVSYETFEEFQLPWGNSVCASGTPYREFYKSLMDAVNYFRKEAEPLTEEVFNKFVICEENKVSQFVRNNISSIKIITRDKVRLTSSGYLGISTEESHLTTKTPYGFTDIIFYIIYSMRTRTFGFNFRSGALNHNVPEQKRIYDLYFDHFYSFEDGYEDKVWNIFTEENLFSKFEFIPLVIEDHNVCVVSHKAYKGKYGKVDEVQCPTRGINILENEKEMKALEDWLSNGGKINKNNMYYILADRGDRSKHYLKRVRENQEG